MRGSYIPRPLREDGVVEGCGHGAGFLEQAQDAAGEVAFECA